jgi:glutamate racemase
MLVALAEEGWADGDIARATLHQYLDPLFDKPSVPDTLILGCTHFPVFAPVLQDILGDGVTLINSGEAASRHLAPYLREGGQEIRRETEFLVTDDPSRFAENAVKFFDARLSAENVHLIDIK